MVSLPGRSGRRRRVLNEEVLSASSSHVVLRAVTNQPAANSARYGDAAAPENYPQITDFIPRRLRTIALLVFGGVAASALVVLGNQFTLQFISALNESSVTSPSPTALSGLATWLGAVLLLVTGVACSLIHSIRRHRIDDIRGRYRIWRWAAAACVLASANSVAGFHALLADVMSHYAGWTALRDGAVWWLLLAGIPLTWLAARTFLDVLEARLVTFLFLTATGAYLAGVASFLGFLPGTEPTFEPLVTSAAILLGHWLLLAAAVSYARHIVLDAQGLIANRNKTAAARESRRSRGADESPISKTAAGPLKVEPSRAASSPTLQLHNPPSSREKTPAPILPAKTQASLKDWVDGRRRERDRYQNDDDGDAGDEMDGDRKLSKAERKQLRKLKARNRAA